MLLDDLPFILKNSYFDEYKKLISNYTLQEGYAEDHHIIYKCFYKHLNQPIDNSASNIIRLLFKDHCLAHWLLYNCTTGEVKDAMANAFISMLGFKANDIKLTAGLSEEEYLDLQEKVNRIKNTEDTKYWTKHDITFLINNYPKRGLRFCAETLGRSMAATKSKVSELNLKIDRYFSNDEVEFLKENFVKFGAKFCARALGRAEACIKTKASRLQLTIDQRYSDYEKQFLLDNYRIKGPHWCAEQLNIPYENIRAYAVHTLKIKALPQGIPIYCPELDQAFSSIKDASLKLNISDGGICQVLNGKQKSIHGLTFIKINKEKYYEERTYQD